MLHTIEIYLLLFLTYAFLGWCMEVICKWIQYKRFINRDFLIGPYCPIYGWGALAITILLKRYTDDVVALFVMAVVICSVIEYFTSYFMEKKYHARWWDYSDKKFNINGRICLETMVPFGILGVIIMYVTNPFFMGIYNAIPETALHIIAGVLFVAFIIDNMVSSKVISSIHLEEEKIADNTEEITTEISNRLKQLIKEKSYLHKRLVNAYPNFKLEQLEKMKARLQKRKEKYERKQKQK